MCIMYMSILIIIMCNNTCSCDDHYMDYQCLHCALQVLRVLGQLAQLVILCESSQPYYWG